MLYNNQTAYGACRYVDNGAGSDLFVPQGNAGDFSAFIDNAPSGVTLAFCVLPTTTTASPSEAASYEIDKEQGPILSPSGSVSSITGIPVASGGIAARYTGSTQKTSVTYKDVAQSQYIAFTYQRADCNPTPLVTTGKKPCNQFYIQERQTLTDPLKVNVASGLGQSYIWNTASGQQTAASTWYKSSSAGGPWTAINGPNYDYDGPEECPPGYAVNSTWTVSTTKTCAAGYTGSYTQKTNYICQSSGVGKITSTTDNSSSQCLPVINGSCGTALRSKVYTKPTANLCGAGSATSVSGSGPWSWNCEGENGGDDASCWTCSPSNVTLSSYYDTGPDPAGVGPNDVPSPVHSAVTNVLNICNYIFIPNGGAFTVTTNSAGSHWQPGVVTWSFVKGTPSHQTITPGSGDDNKSTTVDIYYGYNLGNYHVGDNQPPPSPNGTAIDGEYCNVYAVAKGNRNNGTDYHAVEVALTNLATTAATCP